MTDELDTRVPTDDEQRGMDWWNALNELEREFWLRVAISARPADAWAAYKFSMQDK